MNPRKIIGATLSILILLGLSLEPPRQAAAFVFDPNQIISDSELWDYPSMPLESIQYFLETQGGILGTYRATDYFGVEKSAAEIIYEAAQRYQINPKWIIATLQKEQSLVTNPAPTQYNFDWAMGYAVCDGG